MARVITFYSYKGGSGRSMALANVAWVLASNGERVLVIDWDLEAPGLHRYFAPFLTDKHLTRTSSQGVIDFLIDYVMHYATPDKSRPADWMETFADFAKWSQPLTWGPGEEVQLPHDGRVGLIDFVPAGKQGPDYARNVNLFDFGDFYRNKSGEAMLNAAKRNFDNEKCGQVYDYVLIDSRTGVSDTAGICTVQLPDQLVVCFTLNNQGILGAEAVVKSVRQQRPGMPIFPVPTRVDSKNEHELAASMLQYARDIFTPYLDPKLDANEYWLGVEFNYQPRYAFAEVLAPFEEQLSREASLLPAVESLTGYLAGKPTKLQKLPEKERFLALEEFRARPQAAASITQQTKVPVQSPTRQPAPSQPPQGGVPVEFNRLFEPGSAAQGQPRQQSGQQPADEFARMFNPSPPFALPSAFPPSPASRPFFRSPVSIAVACGILLMSLVFWMMRQPKPDPKEAAAAEKLLADIKASGSAPRPDKAIRIAEAARMAQDNDPEVMRQLREALGALRPLRTGVVTHDGPVRTVLFTPDSNFVASTGDDRVTRLLGVDGQVDRWTAPGSGRALAISKDGYLATCGPNGVCTVFSTKTHEEVRQTSIAKLAGPAEAIAFSADGRFLYIADPSRVSVYGVTPWKFVVQSPSQAPAWSISVSPDNRYYATASRLPPPGLYCKQGDQCNPAQPVEWLKLAPGLAGASAQPTRMVAFSPVLAKRLRRLATAGTDHAARIWDTTVGIDDPDKRDTTPQVSGTLPHDGDVYVVAFSPDGKLLATGSLDSTAKIWNAGSGELKFTLRHKADVRALAWSQDGTVLATGSGDGSARIWDVATGQERLPNQAVVFDREVNSVALSADGRYLATGSTDGTASCWRLLTDADVSGLTAVQIRQLACLQARRNLTAIEWQGYHRSEPYEKACPDLP